MFKVSSLNKGLVMGYSTTCKRRGIKLQLGYVKSLKRWKKTINGKQQYFKHDDSLEGYQGALADWASLTRPSVPEPQATLQRYAEWYDCHHDPEGRAALIRRWLLIGSAPGEVTANMALTIGQLSALEVSGPADGPETLAITLELIRADSIVSQELKDSRLWNERLQVNEPQPKTLTIPEAIHLFLQEKRKLVEIGARKVSTYGTWIDRLKHAKAKLVGIAVDKINAQTISQYHALISQDKNFGGERQRSLFKAFKAFVRWCWEEELLGSLPRNLNKTFEFSSSDDGDYSWMLFNKNEVASMLAKLPLRGRAAVYLGLNCGFTFGDIADLKKSDVDLKAGRLVHKRVKTRKKKNVPMVNYPLWPETVKALAACESDHSELWFISEEGLPLKSSHLVGDRESKWCVMTTQWGKWRSGQKVPQKPHKGLRKTAATLIEGKYPGWETTYLGHAPATVAGRHYVVKDGSINPEFDKALHWLRAELLGTNKKAKAK